VDGEAVDIWSEKEEFEIVVQPKVENGAEGEESLEGFSVEVGFDGGGDGVGSSDRGSRIVGVWSWYRWAPQDGVGEEAVV